MYSKKEAALLRQEFWTALGQYMQPIHSAEGEKVNWVNYKTKEKDIYFRMHADNKKAVIAIELQHNDDGIRELYFEQFIELKKILEETLGEAWEWEKNYMDEYGKSISRIYTSIDHVNIYRKEDWPILISFFKPRIIALDEFWSRVKYGFESLK